MNEAQIEILVLAAQRGDGAALDRLYRHFALPMRKFAYLRVSNAMVADDLVQNVWLKVSRRLQRLSDVSLFRSWLYKALRWEITDWFRASQRELLVADQIEEPVAEPLPEAHSDILSLLALLEKSEKNTAELYYLHELSIREIGLVLDIPQGTVKSRLHRAREQLRMAITQENGEK